jgi:hypothetical protein
MPHKAGKAVSEILSISAAIMVYYLDFGTYPCSDPVEKEQDLLSVISILTGGNREGKVFFEVHVEKAAHLDPWQQPYHIIFDQDNDGCVRVHDSVVSRPVVIWSNGSNMINEYGGGDDIASWRDEGWGQ